MTTKCQSGNDVDISGVERGVRNPAATVIERIATALGVDVCELFDKHGARCLRRAIADGERMAQMR